MTAAQWPREGAVRLRRRQDLTSQRVRYRNQPFWSIGDPIARRFFQLRDEEYYLLNQLDGTTSLEELRQKFQAQFAPQRIELPQLTRFLAMLHRQSLVVADANEQGQRLLERRQQASRRERWRRLTSVLAIRFRGVNPEPLLSRIYPRLRWVFSPVVFTCSVIWILLATAWSLLNADQIAARLPSVSSFIELGNIATLAITLGAVKVLHELAHALTCRHFGGKCRELGVMLLAFTPCLYCDVSDAWMIRSKWKRIAISAAGIWVELCLAATALFCWWFSEPGPFNTLSLSVVVVCSVGTLLVNGNPLLRYDGYFILADWLEVPNLAEQAGETMRRIGLRILGISPAESPLTTNLHPAWLLLYGAASLIYRVLVIAFILYGLYFVLSEHRLRALAQILVLLTVTTALAGPARRAWNFFRSPTPSGGGLPLRAAAVLAAFAAGALALFVPLPSSVSAPATIQNSTKVPIYARRGGSLTNAVREGDKVDIGQVLVRLSDPDTTAEVLRLRGERDLAQVRAANLEREMSVSPDAGGRLVAAQKALADLEQRLSKRLEDEEQLSIVAPVAGIVLPPRTVLRQLEPEEFPTWEGHPLDPVNRGSFLEAGTHLGWIATGTSSEAVLLVTQDDIHLLEEGQPVQLRTRVFPGQKLQGVVSEISKLSVSVIPAELVIAGMMEAERGRPEFQPEQPTYQVSVQLSESTPPLPHFSIARASVQVASRSLASRCYAFLQRTFP